jgi:hypothetical protein
VKTLNRRIVALERIAGHVISDRWHRIIVAGDENPQDARARHEAAHGVIPADHNVILRQIV